MSKHLDIVWTNQFKKDYKLAMKRHLDIDLLDDIIRKLASSEQLPEKNKDHALTGNWVGHRECHIQPDWLLVYRIENDLLVLTLSRTGTHSDLFGKQENALGTNTGCIFLSAEMKKYLVLNQRTIFPNIAHRTPLKTDFPFLFSELLLALPQQQLASGLYEKCKLYHVRCFRT